jgi:hypothetical protein
MKRKIVKAASSHVHLPLFETLDLEHSEGNGDARFFIGGGTSLMLTRKLFAN